MNSPMNRMPAIAIDIPICRDVSRSSSGAASRAEIDSARNPIASAWPSAMIPRRNGLPRIACRFTTESMSWDSTWTSPSGRRTATAHTSRPRIITPSTTAWPP
jgi:hypothetical protein